MPLSPNRWRDSKDTVRYCLRWPTPQAATHPGSQMQTNPSNRATRISYRCCHTNTNCEGTKSAETVPSEIKGPRKIKASKDWTENGGDRILCMNKRKFIKHSIIKNQILNSVPLTYIKRGTNNVFVFKTPLTTVLAVKINLLELSQYSWHPLGQKH